MSGSIERASNSITGPHLSHECRESDPVTETAASKVIKNMTEFRPPSQIEALKKLQREFEEIDTFHNQTATWGGGKSESSELAKYIGFNGNTPGRLVNFLWEYRGSIHNTMNHLRRDYKNRITEMTPDIDYGVYAEGHRSDNLVPIFGTGPLQEFATLSPDHPAYSFLQGILLSETVDSHLQKLADMKSVKAFYEAGMSLWENFPHLHQKQFVNILYPAAGSNVGAMATAMALIDQGAAGAQLTMTEVDSRKIDDAVETLKAWSQANPFFTSDFKIVDYPGLEPGSHRYAVELEYKGRPIHLIYALNDSPSESIFFHPADFKKSDLTIIQDVYFKGMSTDTLAFGRFLPYLNKEGSPQAFLMANELDAQADPINTRGRQSQDLKVSALPLRAWRIHGTFGHANNYPFQFCPPASRDGIIEIGASISHSALLISSRNSLLKKLNVNEEKLLSDFAQLACGTGFPRDPMADKIIGTRDVSLLLKWCLEKSRDLPPSDSQLLKLVGARLFVYKISDPLDPEILQPFLEILASEAIIPEDHLEYLFQQENFGSLLKQIDDKILKLQSYE